MLFFVTQESSNEKRKQLTNFTLNEFYVLCDLMLDNIKVNKFSRRRWNSANSHVDLLFMLLVTTKHGREWSFFATLFRKHVSMFEKTIELSIFIFVTDMESTFIVDAREKCRTIK